MKPFDHIVIIFNPESTGEAPELAKKLKQDLSKKNITSELMPTKYAGHAIEIAEKISLQYKRPLLISVSGDGGYNEVIRGAMQAKATSDTARPVTAVIGAGNANDHARVTRGDTSLVTLIEKGQINPLDILEVQAEAPSYTLHAYAHSYVGLGITPVAGNTLNKSGKSFINELRALGKTFSAFVPFRATIDGTTRLYNNIIFGNINEMAKVVKLHDKVTLNDGKFEVIRFRHYSNLRMILQLLRTALMGVKKSRSTGYFKLTLPEAQLLQLDGEVEKLPAGTTLEITSIKSGMESVY